MKKFDEYRWVPCDTTADAELVCSTVDRPPIVPNIVGPDLETLHLSWAMGATEICGDAFTETLPVILVH